MRPAQLTHPGLYPRWHLVRTPTRPMGPVGQALQPLGAVAAQPGMYGLAGDPVALGDQAHRQPVTDNLYDRVVALLDHAALPQHSPRPPIPSPITRAWWKPSAETLETIS